MRLLLIAAGGLCVAGAAASFWHGVAMTTGIILIAHGCAMSEIQAKESKS